MANPLDLDWSFMSLIEGLGPEAKDLWRESPEKFMENLAELSRKTIVEKVRNTIADVKQTIKNGEDKLSGYRKMLNQYETILKHYDTPPSIDNT